MTTKYPCYLEFSDNGHFARIVWTGKSGVAVIAEFLCSDSGFAERAAAVHDHFKIRDIPRPEMPYLGQIEAIENVDDIREEIEVLTDLLEQTLEQTNKIEELKQNGTTQI
jgi:hypothetical protein